jgi:four helix bundle protein
MDFRFQKLEIWKESVMISKECFHVVEKLRQEKQYSIADQLVRALLSISNNIAEGSGSSSKKDFANYLSISRKSVFECANILIIISEMNLIKEEEKLKLVWSLKELSKKIYYFRKTLVSE